MLKIVRGYSLMASIRSNLSSIKEEIAKSGNCERVRLVAVSKTKPAADLEVAYEAGQRVFGENYINELVEKSHTLAHLGDIKFHFIGNLQKKNCPKLTTCKNLSIVETVGSEKVARALNNGWKKNGDGSTLDIFIQINTSREEQKSGCMPEETISLANFVKSECDVLSLKGVMTIGAFGYDWSQGDNPDFIELLKCHKELCEHFGQDLEISMGMSDDFGKAIEMGSTNVRVGSKIFGARN
ncbi:pyridoxal phosphate homeostasis protein-like [Bolinopsis microptera]|uniref:pyridoxal phosphate homeostasis protein-like n=1 Tax=Bolinopsis microptera TaxID=2820187 RepID=UPI00307A59C1